MQTVTRAFRFEAAHRLLNHPGKCRNLHGHSYVASITVKRKGARQIDDHGMVVDFGMLKMIAGGWIDDNWDHNLILHPEDPLVKMANEKDVEDPTHFLKRVCGRTPYIMPATNEPSYWNPTAENMAYILSKIVQSCFAMNELDLHVVLCVVQETESCLARYDSV